MAIYFDAPLMSATATAYCSLRPSPNRHPTQKPRRRGRITSPMIGMVKPSGPGTGALVILLPPREVVRPEMKRSQLVPARDGMMDEEWITIYGFSPGNTNSVLREFEKCGAILKHIPGPRNANWMNILYQNRYNVQKALGKIGMQLNDVLIIGVKPVDLVQRRYLNERLNSNTSGGCISSKSTKWWHHDQRRCTPFNWSHCFPSEISCVHSHGLDVWILSN